jgi:hypothetical protein
MSSFNEISPDQLGNRVVLGAGDVFRPPFMVLTNDECVVLFQ